MYVKSIVPKEDLLVWNLKDGWEPLFTFLGKPIPDGPIPHENKTSDEEWTRNYGFKHKIFAVGMKHIAKNLVRFLLKILIGLYLFSKCYQWWFN